MLNFKSHIQAFLWVAVIATNTIIHARTSTIGSDASFMHDNNNHPRDHSFPEVPDVSGPVEPVQTTSAIPSPSPIQVPLPRPSRLPFSNVTIRISPRPARIGTALVIRMAILQVSETRIAILMSTYYSFVGKSMSLALNAFKQWHPESRYEYKNQYDFTFVADRTEFLSRLSGVYLTCPWKSRDRLTVSQCYVSMEEYHPDDTGPKPPGPSPDLPLPILTPPPAEDPYVIGFRYQMVKHFPKNNSFSMESVYRYWGFNSHSGMNAMTKALCKQYQRKFSCTRLRENGTLINCSPNLPDSGERETPDVLLFDCYWTVPFNVSTVNRCVIPN